MIYKLKFIFNMNLDSYKQIYVFKSLNRLNNLLFNEYLLFSMLSR